MVREVAAVPCAVCTRAVEPAAVITIGWREERGGQRAHCAVDVCGWTCALRVVGDLAGARLSPDYRDRLHPPPVAPAPGAPPETAA